MWQHRRPAAWTLAGMLAFAIPFSPAFSTAGEVPASVGSQGFLIWETPRNLPELTFEDEKGAPLTLADFHGKVVLLNIWATWCAPCRDEMPTLDSLQTQLGGEQFEVVALSIDHSGHDAVEKFYREINIEHLHMYIDPSTLAPRSQIERSPHSIKVLTLKLTLRISFIASGRVAIRFKVTVLPEWA